MTSLVTRNPTPERLDSDTLAWTYSYGSGFNSDYHGRQVNLKRWQMDFAAESLAGLPATVLQPCAWRSS